MTSEEILQLRKKMGLSIRAFADKIGVNKATIVNWEQGRHTQKACLSKCWNAWRNESPNKAEYVIPDFTGYSVGIQPIGQENKPWKCQAISTYYEAQLCTGLYGLWFNTVDIFYKPLINKDLRKSMLKIVTC